jgi:hypothetical protein
MEQSLRNVEAQLAAQKQSQAMPFGGFAAGTGNGNRERSQEVIVDMKPTPGRPGTFEMPNQPPSTS